MYQPRLVSYRASAINTVLWFTGQMGIRTHQKKHTLISAMNYRVSAHRRSHERCTEQNMAKLKEVLHKMGLIK
jgi:hypothetical protein